MPELIDRQAVLKKMCETCGYCEKFEKAMRATHPDFVTDKCNNYKFLAEQPTIESEPVRHGRWIPCIERLPEPLQNVIVCTDINTVTVAWLNGDHWTFADTGGGHTENWSFDAVKYWMYLPEPPEGEQKLGGAYNGC